MRIGGCLPERAMEDWKIDKAGWYCSTCCIKRKKPWPVSASHLLESRIFDPLNVFLKYHDPIRTTKIPKPWFSHVNRPFVLVIFTLEATKHDKTINPIVDMMKRHMMSFHTNSGEDLVLATLAWDMSSY